MTKSILLVAVFCMALLGCAASQETALNVQPLGYDDTMERLADELRLVDKYVTGGQYSLAVPRAERVVALANQLEQFEPPRMGKSFAEYQEFKNQAIDMRHATDRLDFLVQQRRRDEANEQIVVTLDRYNHISRRYGPGIELTPLARDQGGMRGPTGAHTNLPGGLQGR